MKICYKMKQKHCFFFFFFFFSACLTHDSWLIHVVSSLLENGFHVGAFMIS